MFKRSLFVLGALLASGSAQAAVLVNFETATDFTNNFNLSGTAYTFTTATPTVGTASLSTAANANSIATYSPATFGMDAGEQITIAMKFAKIAPTSVGSPLLQLGFGNATSDTFNNGTTTARSIYTRILPRTTGTGTDTFDLVWDNKSGTGAAGETTGQAGFGIQNIGGNNFFLYTAVFQRTGTNTFVISGKIERLAADNVTPTAVIASGTSGTLTNADLGSLATADGLSAAFRSAGSNFGTFRLDEFSVSDPSPIPEPASLSILGLGAAAMLRRRR